MEEYFLKYFRFEHLPPGLQTVSKPFAELAQALMRSDPHDPQEMMVALRKLLEAKDAAVRSML